MAITLSDTRPAYVMNAWLSLIRTVFVAFILSYGTMKFSQDVEELVLTPIENMLKTV